MVNRTVERAVKHPFKTGEYVADGEVRDRLVAERVETHVDLLDDRIEQIPKAPSETALSNWVDGGQGSETYVEGVRESLSALENLNDKFGIDVDIDDYRRRIEEAVDDGKRTLVEKQIQDEVEEAVHEIEGLIDEVDDVSSQQELSGLQSSFYDCVRDVEDRIDEYEEYGLDLNRSLDALRSEFEERVGDVVEQFDDDEESDDVTGYEEVEKSDIRPVDEFVMVGDEGTLWADGVGRGDDGVPGVEAGLIAIAESGIERADELDDDGFQRAIELWDEELEDEFEKLRADAA